MELVLLFLNSIIWALVIGFIPAIIAKNKGRNFFRWYIYGVLIFIVAIVHVMFIKDESGIKCPVCQKRISENSSICKYCHTVLADYYRDHPTLPPDKFDKDDTTL
ncbi:MAG: hypothetical protein RSB38_07645 [Oscillospiraceae bacterium]